MRIETIEPIMEYIRVNQPARVVDMIQHTWLSKIRVHKILKYLIEEKKLIKSWRPPKVYYEIAQNEDIEKVDFAQEDRNILEKQYLYIDARGKRYNWVDWFIRRCGKWNQKPLQKIKDYRDILKYIDSIRWICWCISAYEWFSKKIWDAQLNQLYYLELYQLLEFGKSKLASLSYYAKQWQSKELVREVIELTKERIDCFLKKEKFDAVCYIPWSVPRDRQQFMDELNKGRDIRLPYVYLEKISRDIIVPQKSLDKIHDRIMNARETIIVWKNNWTYNHVLLIDDFVGSWWTMNESARKLKESWIAKKITWLSLVGNIDMKYEVIREI